MAEYNYYSLNKELVLKIQELKLDLSAAQREITKLKSYRFQESLNYQRLRRATKRFVQENTMGLNALYAELAENEQGDVKQFYKSTDIISAASMPNTSTLSTHLQRTDLLPELCVPTKLSPTLLPKTNVDADILPLSTNSRAFSSLVCEEYPELVSDSDSSDEEQPIQTSLSRINEENEGHHRDVYVKTSPWKRSSKDNNNKNETTIFPILRSSKLNNSSSTTYRSLADVFSSRSSEHIPGIVMSRRKPLNVTTNNPLVVPVRCRHTNPDHLNLSPLSSKSKTAITDELSILDVRLTNRVDTPIDNQRHSSRRFQPVNEPYSKTGRPKRKAAPTQLAEPKLSTKMRGNGWPKQRK